jgi:hypothetical protein
MAYNVARQGKENTKHMKNKIFFWIFAMILLVFALSPDFATAIKNPNHYYNFNEASGNLIDLVASTNFSSVGFVGYNADGKHDYSYIFNGTGYLNSSTTPFGGDGNGARAISLWIYNNQSTDYGIIYDTFDESNYGDEVIYDGSGNIIWRWHFNTLGSRDWQYTLGANNTWHNIFFALSSENPPASGNINCTLWVDGVNTGISKRCEGLFSLPLPTCIGTGVTGYLPSSCTGSNMIKGIKIDEVASWQGLNTNSTFYSDADAQFLYNSGIGMFWNGSEFVNGSVESTTFFTNSQFAPFPTYSNDNVKFNITIADVNGLDWYLFSFFNATAGAWQNYTIQTLFQNNLYLDYDTFTRADTTNILGNSEGLIASWFTYTNFANIKNNSMRINFSDTADIMGGILRYPTQTGNVTQCVKVHGNLGIGYRFTSGNALVHDGVCSIGVENDGLIYYRDATGTTSSDILGNSTTMVWCIDTDDTANKCHYQIDFLNGTAPIQTLNRDTAVDLAYLDATRIVARGDDGFTGQGAVDYYTDDVYICSGYKLSSCYPQKSNIIIAMTNATMPDIDFFNWTWYASNSLSQITQSDYYYLNITDVTPPVINQFSINDSIVYHNDVILISANVSNNRMLDKCWLYDSWNGINHTFTQLDNVSDTCNIVYSVTAPKLITINFMFYVNDSHGLVSNYSFVRNVLNSIPIGIPILNVSSGTFLDEFTVNVSNVTDIVDNDTLTYLWYYQFNTIPPVILSQNSTGTEFNVTFIAEGNYYLKVVAFDENDYSQESNIYAFDYSVPSSGGSNLSLFINQSAKLEFNSCPETSASLFLLIFLFVIGIGMFVIGKKYKANVLGVIGGIIIIIFGVVIFNCQELIGIIMIAVGVIIALISAFIGKLI